MTALLEAPFVLVLLAAGLLYELRANAGRWIGGAASLSPALLIAVATTGIGFRGWVEAADGWGLGDALLDRLRSATLLARGPKARGAIRAAGLVDAWSPPSESSAEVLDYLLGQDLTGRRIAVQLHGEPLPDFVDALRDTGAEVVEVPVYRWVLPEDVAPVRRLVDQMVARQVDAVAFTSAPAVASLLRLAADVGLDDEVVAGLRSGVRGAGGGPGDRRRARRGAGPPPLAQRRRCPPPGPGGPLRPPTWRLCGCCRDRGTQARLDTSLPPEGVRGSRASPTPVRQRGSAPRPAPPGSAGASRDRPAAPAARRRGRARPRPRP